MEQLLSLFSGSGIPAHEIAQIADAFKYKQVYKGEYFVAEGKTSNGSIFFNTAS